MAAWCPEQHQGISGPAQQVMLPERLGSDYWWSEACIIAMAGSKTDAQPGRSPMASCDAL